jgi:branched-chain amino acid transport system substrate-binding protein
MMAPITGGAASIGLDQLHWAQFYLARYNAKHKRKFRLIQGDTQLNAAQASTVSQGFASNSAMLGTIGPAGSQEVISSTPILKGAGMGFISGSATRVDLTDGSRRGYFFRVVPNDGVQGPTDANYMTSKLGVKRNDQVYVIDDQEAYSTGLSDIVERTLKAKGVNVKRESVSQSQTDFSSLVAKINRNVKVVYIPWQLAPQAQLFGQQLRSAGKTNVLFGADGLFDPAKFTINGSYVSFFAPDVTTSTNRTTKRLVTSYKRKYGETGPFGAPNWVAAQVLVGAINRACKDGKVSRAEVRRQIARTSLRTTILGSPMAFTRNGDVAGARFFIYQIRNGKYVSVG